MKYVVNKKASKTFDVYVGRPTRWGNPFSHLQGSAAKKVVSTREEAVESFKKWLNGSDFQDFEQEQRLWILEHIKELKGKILCCWCAPSSCHADVLAEMANI